MDPKRLVHRTVHYLFDNKTEGDLLMNVPPKQSREQLKELVSNRFGWRQKV